MRLPWTHNCMTLLITVWPCVTLRWGSAPLIFPLREPQERTVCPRLSLVCECAVSIGPLESQSFFFFFFFLSLVFLGPHLQHMEVPRLGVESQLQPLAYARATATPDPSQVCNLHHSSWQHQSFNPLRPGIKLATSWFLVRFVSSEPQRELQQSFSPSPH